MKDLKLYVLQQCPYCNKVRRYLEENNIDVEINDVADPTKQAELMEIGGKDQVPMLLVGGEPLYESDDIIEWFKNNK